MLRDFCRLYNACLQQRIEAYRRRGLTLSYNAQSLEIKNVRASEPEIKRWSFTALLRVLRRVDQTYKAFFRRGHGFPRFKSSQRYHSASFKFGDGVGIGPERRLNVLGIPQGIKVVWHREIPASAKILSSIITRKNGKWYASFAAETLDNSTCGDGSIGIDLGLTSIVALSDGSKIEAPRFLRRSQAKLRSKQRALARCVRGSNRRAKAKARLARAHEKVANQRKDFAHKLSSGLVLGNSLIAFEKLNVKGMAKGLFSRAIHDVAWSQLVHFTTYKAESAGGCVIMVDAKGTSQTCPACGSVKRKALSQRVHICDCGIQMDRDVAAAKIVLQRALLLRPGHGLQALTGQSSA